ncbi:FtsW/RodA/SpoVE family cell cycle protein [Janibacter massiliensis]|mgnify:FL=1|uniref:FtsW/RodA/SpoVE family cell cycle protein n=1 Tax=Janibacter massiliensis TaxID=2058291 RepID=UPI000D10233E|nr:FtsW/RodA/SpoVE family cell cycle protein [Janibacter massiliensis]
MTAVTSVVPKRGRTAELVLLLVAVGIVVLAYVNVELATHGSVPADLLTHGGILLAIALAFHLVLRWKASYADPLILPIVTLLNGLGVVMIHRLDIAAGREVISGLALKQLWFSALGVAIAIGVLVLLRDHRLLRRYTYTAGLAAIGLLLLPLLPVIGREINGSRIWIGIGPFTFQPAELTKIVLAIFFAGYLVQTRDVLSIAGRKVLGITFPRGRDLGPILVAWVMSVGVLVLQTDLGTSLLLFGLFVAMLYIATERVSWIVLGLTLAAGGAYVAYQLFGHLQQRVALWLDPFDPGQSDQVAKGLMGMAAGGMMGTGLGRGRPDINYLPFSDMIFPALGEELGLVGLFAILCLYALLVERGMRTAIGLRDGFGKLLAAGLAFIVALQVFVTVGGVTRVIPMTGLTLPFMAYGGSSLLTNWTLAAIMLRISDHARRPLPQVDEDTPTPGSIPAVRSDHPTEVVS